MANIVIADTRPQSRRQRHRPLAGIERAVLIPEQEKGGNLVKAIATGIEALKAANAHLSPEEQNEHIVVFIAFPEPLAGEELTSLILAEEPRE